MPWQNSGDNMKATVCNRCSVDLDDTNWYPSAAKRRWLICKSCAKNRLNEYLRKNPEIVHNQNRRSKYGIEFSDYTEMLEKQNFTCAICSRFERYKGRKNLAVDHCHKTGKVRGLLCSSCNKGLGLFEDNLEFIKNAEKYLEGNLTQLNGY